MSTMTLPPDPPPQKPKQKPHPLTRANQKQLGRALQKTASIIQDARQQPPQTLLEYAYQLGLSTNLSLITENLPHQILGRGSHAEDILQQNQESLARTWQDFLNTLLDSLHPPANTIIIKGTINLEEALMLALELRVTNIQAFLQPTKVTLPDSVASRGNTQRVHLLVPMQQAKAALRIVKEKR